MRSEKAKGVVIGFLAATALFLAIGAGGQGTKATEYVTAVAKTGKVGEVTILFTNTNRALVVNTQQETVIGAAKRRLKVSEVK